MQLIPSLDLLDGRVVRLHQGKKNRAIFYEKDPLNWLREIERAGFPLVHIVDLNGALDGERKHDELLQKITHRLTLRVQTGGGIRSEETARRLIRMGISRLVLSTAVFEQSRWIKTLESYKQQMVVALDVEQEKVKIRGWQQETELYLEQALRLISRWGFVRVLITDIQRDGTLSSCNQMLYRKVKRRFPHLTVQASGGISSLSDLRALEAAGVEEAIVGKAILEGKLSLSTLRRYSGR